eukprot:CAMPEP_0197689584 /NCGR_PEP_ID=MMETSP1338-20131121/107107_1 /TAXON_ID=43686 ORGANISM="Pelagodinium beii, Strain RCC1491" /NCGR_SAMPLE_ID=MMETSP1338 /ASSEMBLY_ACC=CAM_ASM_000754 /LENGTH=97 /DNA_ID=CAMNT_0043271937 /DNA_START=26 /DNA_END=316 /DNA_ORIENTATION=+
MAGAIARAEIIGVMENDFKGPIPKPSPAPALPPDPVSFLPPKPSFSMKSTNFVDMGDFAAAQVNGSMGLWGQDKSPQLSWSGFPAETKSFAITMYDP